MNDGIIKADGTSRLMRAELPATYEEFRAQAAAGALPMDILFNADGWTQLPTFLNKGALLKDLTAALYGLGTGAVPDDVLAWIGQYNQRWWRRRTPSYYEAVVGEYGDKPLSWSSSQSSVTKVQYSDSITIDAAGVISLVAPVTISVSYTNYTAANVIKGKYFRYKLLTGEGTTTPESGSDYSGVHLAANADATQDVDTTTSDDVNFYIVYMSAAPVTSLFTDAGQWEYLRSSERNAYPDSGTSDGYEYEYFGIPFENAVGAPKIAVGSYVGTGTYGSDNPNSLTFNSNPLLVVIFTNVPTIFARGMEDAATQTSPGSGGYAAITWDEKTVSWYAQSGYWGSSSSSFDDLPNASKQLNTEYYVYHYAALLR